MDFDIRPFLKPGDPMLTDPRNANGAIEGIYQFKYRMAKLLQPKTILEIGVRAGYSMAAFLSACPEASYFGLDADNGTHGGEKGYCQWAMDMEQFWGRSEIRICDTLGIVSLNLWSSCQAFDLVHVDGDHTYEGCSHDLKLAEKVATWILVDDTTHLVQVAAAVDSFLQRSRAERIHFPTLRGDCLIRVR